MSAQPDTVYFSIHMNLDQESCAQKASDPESIYAAFFLV